MSDVIGIAPSALSTIAQGITSLGRFNVSVVERVKMEITMRKIVLALLGAALMAGSTGQIAYAKSRHHVRHEQQSSERLLNSNAALMPAPERDAGGMGGWASMTGFN
jgi:hypothetical protein